MKALSFFKDQLAQAIKSTLMNNNPPGFNLGSTGNLPHLKDLKKIAERFKISSFLPYESFDMDSGLYYNRDTVGFMLLASPATSLGLNDLKILNGIMSDHHQSNTCLQVTLFSSPEIGPILEQWRQHKLQEDSAASSTIFELLAKNRSDYLQSGKWESLFSEQEFLLRDLFLVISYSVYLPVQGLSLDDVNYLQRKRSAIQGNLSSAKILALNLDPESFLNLFRPFFNPSYVGHERVNYCPYNLLAEQLVDADTALLLDAGASTLIHQEQKFSLLPFHVRQFPQSWAGYNNGELIGRFLDNLQKIPGHFLITLTVQVPDQMMAKSLAKRKFTRATQMLDSPIAKFVPQWRDRKRDWEYVSAKLDNGDVLLSAFYQIVLLTPQGRESEAEQKIKSLYSSLGWQLSKSRFIPLHSLLGAMPMGLCQEGQQAMKAFGHYRMMPSWNCTNLAPWIGEWKGTKTPMMLFTGRRGQLSYFNPFDNTKGNFNIACCAASGAGKSFFTQEWIFSALGAGGRAFVIDAGHSYKNLCELLGGTYLDFGSGMPNLNPFSKIFSPDKIGQVNKLSQDSGDGDYGLENYINDFMPMLKALLSQMASPKRDLDETKSSCLEIALNSAVQKYKHQTTITKVAAEILLQKDQNQNVYPYAHDLALMLHPYTCDGMYGRYFEGENNIDLDNNFVVLDLDALNAKGDLQLVVLLILMMQINQVMYLAGNKGQIKQVIIDEAWRLLGEGRSGKFIEEGYRVARKHGGSYMTVVQKISDYFSSEVAKAAFMNSDFEIYLRQKPAELANAVAAGQIDNSDGKVDILRSLETVQGKYSEMAINSPDGLSVVRFCVDPITEKIYSTQAAEVDFIRNAQKNNVSLLEAINQLIAQNIAQGKKR